jgi:hypothetical protein
MAASYDVEWVARMAASYDVEWVARMAASYDVEWVARMAASHRHGGLQQGSQRAVAASM